MKTKHGFLRVLETRREAFHVDCVVVWSKPNPTAAGGRDCMDIEDAHLVVTRQADGRGRNQVHLSLLKGDREQLTPEALASLKDPQTAYVLTPAPGFDQDRDQARAAMLARAFSLARRQGFNTSFAGVPDEPLDLLPHLLDHRVINTGGDAEQFGVKVRVVWHKGPYLVGGDAPKREGRCGYLYWYPCEPNGVTVVRFLPDEYPMTLQDLQAMGDDAAFSIFPCIAGIRDAAAELQAYRTLWVEAIRSGAPVTMAALAKVEAPEAWPTAEQLSKRMLMVDEMAADEELRAEGRAASARHEAMQKEWKKGNDPVPLNGDIEGLPF